jgi:purine-binding chemotaxis protein CheW
MSKELHIVGFRIGREHYGVPIISVQEIVRVPEITAVPDAPAHIEGVINLRGKIVSIIDLRKRFGEKNITSDRRNRILVTEFQHRLAGLIVDAASEVVKIPATDVDPPPAIFEEGSGLQCVTGVGKYRGRLIMLLDLGQLLQNDLRPERPAMAAAATAAADPAPAPNPSKGPGKGR